MESFLYTVNRCGCYYGNSMALTSCILLPRSFVPRCLPAISGSWCRSVGSVPQNPPLVISCYSSFWAQLSIATVAAVWPFWWQKKKHCFFWFTLSPTWDKSFLLIPITGKTSACISVRAYWKFRNSG